MATPPSDHYALILAGGSGERFWPVSRNARPKQLLDLFGDGTLIAKTVARLSGIVPVENIIILTNAVQLDGIRAAVPEIPQANIIAEPAKRDTAPAIGLGVALIAARNPHATMAVLPADQLITDHDAFHGTLSDAFSAASTFEGALMTIGIRPTWPCPSYGYIQRGEDFGAPLASGTQVYRVARFTEKPAPEKAAEFLQAGGFSWNAGMFIWSIPSITAALKSHCPDIASFVNTIAASSDIPATIASDFPALPKLSIDYALMEKAETVLSMEAKFDWDDVGGWVSVAGYLDESDSNRTNQPLSSLDSRDNIVFSDAPTHVALLGVDNLIIVRSGDALLIANKDRADDIKKIVKDLPENLV